MQADLRPINRLQIIACMSLEKLLRSVNCPVNLKAEHYRVHDHVVEALAFLHIQHKDDIFANEFHHLSQSGTMLFPPLYNSSPLQAHPSEGD